MSRSLLQFGQQTLAALVVMVAAACAQTGAGGDHDRVTIQSESGVHIFTIELADEPEERRVGLMFRTEMAQDAGMLFDFGQPQPVSMWMKNTLIPLDMAFIDESGVIKRIAAETTPQSLAGISSGGKVVAVLEVNGGVFEMLGVQEGDRVIHPIFSQN